MTTTDEMILTDEPATRTSHLTVLVSGILTDVQDLFRQQIKLIRAEFVEDLRRTRQVAQCYGLGTLLLAVGTVMLLVAGVHLLQYATGWPAWACWGLVGGGSLLFGGLAIFAGSRILASFNPLPDKSFNALQENVSCLTNPQS